MATAGYPSFWQSVMRQWRDDPFGSTTPGAIVSPRSDLNLFDYVLTPVRIHNRARTAEGNFGTGDDFSFQYERDADEVMRQEAAELSPAPACASGPPECATPDSGALS